MRNQLFTLAIVFCACHRQTPTQPLLNANRNATLLSTILIDDPDARGLSGLDRYRQGWITVAERSGYAFEITRDGFAKIPIQGLPDGVDLEGVASLNDDTLLLSTESPNESESEPLLIAKRKDAGFIVESSLIVPSADDWNFQDNKGLEGVCVTNEAIWAASEVVTKHDGTRYAPLVKIDRTALETPAGPAKVTWFSIALSSDEGKISALSCAQQGSSTKLWGIERHYDIARILEVELKAETPPSAHLSTQVVLELSVVQQDDENFEGLVRGDDGGWTLINDNEHAVISGKSKLWMLR